MKTGFKTLKTAAFLSGVLALAVSVNSVPTDTAYAKKVKCYGIAKAGQNDCGNAAGTHSCAGHATVDYDGGEWVAVDSEKCLAEGGSPNKSFVGVNPNKS